METAVAARTSRPPYAALALSLTVPEWTNLGVDSETQAPHISESNKTENDVTKLLVERMTALFLIRVVAMATARESPDQKVFSDYSTSSICRTAIMMAATGQSIDEENENGGGEGNGWPHCITEAVINQIHEFVRSIVEGYGDRKEIPYHNKHHAFHVTISTNKLIDLLWNHGGGPGGTHVQTKSFGLKQDTVALAALLFSAIIHDVEHPGIGNRQLTMEDDELAILYNDQSILENRSLFVAFQEFLKPGYRELREVMFGAGDPNDKNPKGGHNKDQYRGFRQHCVNLVLNTDIASPQLTQLGKSKWQEAFGQFIKEAEEKEEEDEGMLAILKKAQEKEKEKEEKRHPPERARSGGAEPMMPRRASSGIGGPIAQGPMTRRASGGATLPIFSPIMPGRNVDDNGEEQKPQQITAPFQPMPPQRNRRRPGRRRSGFAGSADSGDDDADGNPAKVIQDAEKGRFKKKLGIRQSMDLSGEALEAFSSMRKLDLVDEPDDLKAQVIMEQILTAADVAHNLQGWIQMKFWSTRLYLELRKAFVLGRGFDASAKWFENQIGFLESYLEPLAKRLGDTGVFGPIWGPKFVEIVRGNRDQWIEKGLEVSKAAVAKGELAYPLD